MKIQKLTSVVMLLFSGFITVSAMADYSNILSGDIRLRWERSDDSVSEIANALTARGALKWEHKRTDQAVVSNVVVELEGNVGVGDYNDGGVNDKFEYAVIADPNFVEINQAYFTFLGRTDDELGVAVGRQELNYGPGAARYIGNVGWRQNHQTFDAVTVDASIGAGDFKASYIWNVNRIFSEENPNPLLANLELQGLAVRFAQPISENIQARFFLYHFDFTDAGHLSTRTAGASFDGKYPINNDFGITLSGTYALQTAIGDTEITGTNLLYALSIGTDIAAIKGNVSYGRQVLGGAEENRVEGDRDHIVHFPLASNHLYQGYADIFLRSPFGGIADNHLSYQGTLSNVKLLLRYHEFKASESRQQYGTEFDLVVSGAVNSQWNWNIKIADYQAITLGLDTEKVAVWIQRSY